MKIPQIPALAGMTPLGIKLNTAHTPGPWSLGATQIVVSLGGFSVHAIPISGSGSAIGCAYAGSVGRPRSVEVEYANAALIAAAPDMLAALRACEDRLGVLIECDNEDHGGACDDDVDAWSAARAAIAKAEGRS